MAALLPLTFRPLMFEVSFHRNMETLCRGEQELEELEQRHELTIPLCLVLLLHDARVKVDKSRLGDMYLIAILTGWKVPFAIAPSHLLDEVVEIRRQPDAIAAMTVVATDSTIGSSSGRQNS